MGGSVGTFLGRRQRAILFAATGFSVALLTLLPLLCLAGELAASGPGELRQSLAVLGSPRLWILLGHSLGLAMAVTVLALAIGVPLGVLLGRTDAAGRRPALLLHLFPMFLPPFLLALGWFHVFGREGVLGSALTAGLLFSPLGVIMTLAFAFTPVVTALVALGLQGIDPSLEEAARVVARPWRVVRRILLPAAWPAAGLAAILVFALSISELGVPMFLRVDVYPAAVLTRLGGVSYAPGEAFALVFPLLAIAVAMLLLERLLAGRRPLALLAAEGRTRWRIPLGRWRGALGATGWLAAALPMTPLLSLAWRAGRGGGFSRLHEWMGASLLTTLLSAAAAATLIAVLGLILGQAMVRGAAGAACLDSLTWFAFVAPAPVLGVGLIAAWNHAATRFLYGSVAILIVGYAARYLVAGARTVAASLVQGAPHLEEAAAAFGARFVRRLVRIVLPLHRRGVMGAWLLALVFCVRDLDLVVLFYPAGWEPLTVRIFTLEANGPAEVVAALATVQVLATAAILAAGGGLVLVRRPG